MRVQHPPSSCGSVHAGRICAHRWLQEQEKDWLLLLLRPMPQKRRLLLIDQTAPPQRFPEEDMVRLAQTSDNHRQSYVTPPVQRDGCLWKALCGASLNAGNTTCIANSLPPVDMVAEEVPLSLRFNTCRRDVADVPSPCIDVHVGCQRGTCYYYYQRAGERASGISRNSPFSINAPPAVPNVAAAGAQALRVHLCEKGK